MDSLSRPAATSSGKGSSAASRSSSWFSRSRCRLEGLERPVSAACSLRGAATRYRGAGAEPAPSIPRPEPSPALIPDPNPAPSPAPISHPDPAPGPVPIADPAPHLRSGRRLPPLAPRVHGSGEPAAAAGEERGSAEQPGETPAGAAPPPAGKEGGTRGRCGWGGGGHRDRAAAWVRRVCVERSWELGSVSLGKAAGRASRGSSVPARAMGKLGSD